jgi:formate dehydrogenase major subunit
MINLIIDGKKIEAVEGTTVLNAARSAGVTIPTLCDEKHLTPYGGCRLCLVEVDGARTLQPSCTLPVSNNMVVRTDTAKTKAARKFILTMIFSERNHFCPYCQVSGGDCELQNAAYHEGMTNWPLSPNYTPFSMDASHPYIILENNRCILCRRCVRACSELVGNFTLGFDERGGKSMLICDIGLPWGSSSCISCGMCVQECPTGALIDRWSAYKGRETQVEKTKTVCTGCSVGCGIEVLTRDNNLVRIESDWDSAVGKGLTCKLGRFIPMVEQRERIHTPLVKKNGALKAVTWDEAIDVISGKMKPLAGKKEKGLAAIVSSKLSIETLYHFKQLFADKFGSSMVTSTEEGTQTANATQVARKMKKSFEGKLASLDNADCVVTFGVDLEKEHEVAGFFVKRQIPNGLKLIVIDSGSNNMKHWAKVSLKPAKGITSEYINSLSEALKSGKGKTKEDNKAIEILKTATKKIFVFSGVLDAKVIEALIEFAKLAGAELISLKGEANSVAASLLDLEQPFKLNGQQMVYVALADQEPSKNLITALKNTPFMVVQATYISKLSTEADVVLPTNHWFEEEGHFITLDGKIQSTKKSMKVIEDNMSNEEVLEALAKKLDLRLNNDWRGAISGQVTSVAIQA